MEKQKKKVILSSYSAIENNIKIEENICNLIYAYWHKK